MLKIEELRAEVKGEFFLKEELARHNVKKVDALADIIIKPTGKRILPVCSHFLTAPGTRMLSSTKKGGCCFPTIGSMELWSSLTSKCELRVCTLFTNP